MEVKVTEQLAEVPVGVPKVQEVGEKTPHGAGLHVHETVPVGEPKYGGVSVTVAVQLVDL